MKGKKQFRFAAIGQFCNVFEYPENMAEQWAHFFGNRNDIILELACGKGEYTLALAQNNTDKNFVGVDIKGNRMYVGAKKALDNDIKNVAFLRTQIQRIEEYFAPKSVAGIWITFPDPFLRESKAKNRLTHSRFLKYYQAILKDNAVIHLKTDSKPLFDFTMEMISLHKCTVVERIDNVYAHGEPEFPLSVKTFYEQQHLANHRTIQYICFRLPKEPIVVPPKKKNNEEETTF